MSGWHFFGNHHNAAGERVGIKDAFGELKIVDYTFFEVDGDVAMVANKDRTWSCFVKTLNGMCGVMLIYSLQIHLMTQKDIAFLVQLAQWGGYTYIMATNITGGNYEKTLKDFGFEIVKDFTNKRTSNPVAIFMKPV